MRDGLEYVLSAVPVGRGYLDGTAAASTLTGPYARIEAGYRVASGAGLFGFGEYQWRTREAMAGIGARLSF